MQALKLTSKRAENLKFIKLYFVLFEMSDSKKPSFLHL